MARGKCVRTLVNSGPFGGRERSNRLIAGTARFRASGGSASIAVIAAILLPASGDASNRSSAGRACGGVAFIRVSAEAARLRHAGSTCFSSVTRIGTASFRYLLKTATHRSNARPDACNRSNACANSGRIAMVDLLGRAN